MMQKPCKHHCARRGMRLSDYREGSHILKITFENQSVNHEYRSDKVQVEKKDALRGEKMSFYAGTITSFDGADRVFGKEVEKKSFGSKEKSSLKELSMQAGSMDVDAMQDRMLLCAHTMSEEDYGKLQKDGFDPADMTPEETVTILDKIKAELVRSGQEIVGYTDSIDISTLSAAVGSEALARNIVSKTQAGDLLMSEQLVNNIVSECQNADLPVTRQLIEEVAGAVQVGKNIAQFGEQAQSYLLENHLEPTIYEMSLAAFGSTAMESGGMQAHLGNAFQEGEGVSEEELVHFLEKNGISANKENMETSIWLMQHSLEISMDAIACKQGLDQMQFPLSEELLVKASVAAVSDGKTAMDGNLLQPDSLWQKSLDFLQKANGEADFRNLTERIKLEEIRLMMTADANLALLQSDYSIDTSEMEKMIEEMKQVREKMAESLFPNTQEPTLLYDRWEETESYVTQIKNMPVDTLGSLYDRLPQMDLKQVAEEGSLTEKRLREAGLEYEKCMTVPRADLGDRIQKAFANVDDILRDYGLEESEVNRKAVRTLAYCHMEIQPENIERIREALTTVDNLTNHMTPGAVLKMLRDGINPLEKSVAELTKYFEELPEDLKAEGEKYSHFLYHLEKNKEITEEERESFIGCYRLLRQIEKTDGAVIGDLVNTGAEWNLKNLLSAVRSRKAQGTNRVVDDSVGALSSPAEIKKSIEAQIASVFRQDVEKEYVEEGMEAYRENLQQASKELLQEMLQREVEVTPENIQVMHTLLEEGDVVLHNLRVALGKSFYRLQTSETEPMDSVGMNEAALEEKTQESEAALNEFTESLPENFTEFAEGLQETLQDSISDVENRIFEKDQLLDVRSLQLMHKQLSVMEQLTGQNEYYFTLQLDKDRSSAIHMQFVDDAEKQGNIELDISDPVLGRIRGELKVSEGVVQGYLLGNLPETVMKMQEKVDIINTKLPKEVRLGRVDMFSEKSWTTNRLPQGEERTKAQDPETLFKVATVFMKELLA